ncbi:hypothetical protein MJG53_007438 [Ovis ammon polii x Ovis aries]|uniref:Uncharacterized protein n=1 Tax=Ovis ammon polii x Ovis aries TaxID=2918886 RepID=A0ACB9V324_9CETA|nr:hypothetical protein MJT46_006992 [Ovis ammon polii x Ovis aries]KAI4584159.1 hypothetical protein MJG53_007438 [Ovis ammon polii x Ovis aries]
MAAERSLWVVGLCPGSGLGRVVRVLLLLLWFAARGGALYFHIGETEKKCFIEEIPDETMVIDWARPTSLQETTGRSCMTSSERSTSRPPLGLACSWRLKTQRIKLSWPGSMALKADSPSPPIPLASIRSVFTPIPPSSLSLLAACCLPYLVCLQRVHLDIQVGEHANDYAEIAAKDKLSELQLRVRQLVEQVEQIQKEQNYQRWREERFRQTSESTNQRVLWWSILQTLILVAIGVWQMRHLKSFFEAKKLV